MIDVGDTVRLTTSSRDSSGNLVDVAGGVQATVKLPDGTTTAGANATRQSTGTYTLDFATVQAGRHLARFVGTGFADTSPFSVWPTDPGMLFSIDEGKHSLRVRSGQTAYDDEDLRFYIIATTPVIEDIVGPLLPAAKVKVADGGGMSILLPATGVQRSSVSITESGTPVADFTVNEAAGIVSAGTQQAPRPFLWGRQNVVVTYSVGGASIPPNVLLAAREEFRFLFQQGQQASRPSMNNNSGATPVDFTPSGFAVPRRVIELCGTSRRIGGFA